MLRTSDGVDKRSEQTNVVGYIKGRVRFRSHGILECRQPNFTGEVFWARGYFVSTAGLDEEMVRACIRDQEQEDDRYDQMKLGL